MTLTSKLLTGSFGSNNSLLDLVIQIQSRGEKLKIIDTNKIKTEFNLYHKFLYQRSRRSTIKRFNKECKKAIGAGKNEVALSIVEGSDHYGYSGRARLAIQQGELEAIKEIQNEYNFATKCGYFGGSYKVFII